MPYTPGTLGLREDLFSTTLTIQSTTKSKLFSKIPVDKATGGGAKSKDSKYRPANGTENQLSLGGPKEIDNLVLDALYNNETMSLTELIEAAGKAQVSVARTALDEDGNPLGETLNYQGKLMDFTPPPIDSESEKASVVQFSVSLTSELSAAS